MALPCKIDVFFSYKFVRILHKNSGNILIGHKKIKLDSTEIIYYFTIYSHYVVERKVFSGSWSKLECVIINVNY